MVITTAELQSQLQAILDQLQHYRGANNYLQGEVDKHKLVKIFQEKMTQTLEIQNQILEKKMKVSEKCYQIRMSKYCI